MDTGKQAGASVGLLSPARLQRLVYPPVGSPPLELRDGGKGGVPGLRLRVSATVARWNLAIRDNAGRSRRFSMGEYPRKGLQQARDDARALREKVRDGADPVAEKRERQKKAKSDKADTLSALLDLYGKKVGKHRSSWPTSMRPAIENVFKSALGNAVSDLTRTGLQMIATSHARSGAAATAVRSLRPVLRWAEQNGLASEELIRIKPPVTPQRRKRILSRDELACVLSVMRTSTKPQVRLMLFLLYTLARRDEAASARWRDIDEGARTWTIPVTKNGEQHIVPLSRQALELLGSIEPENAKPDDLVFRATAHAGHAGGKLSGWDRATKALHRETSTSGWQRHDLRRTGATLLGEMGVMPDIIEAALNHATIHSPIAATYNRSRYRPQVAAALQRLGDYYDGILEGGAKIVPLGRSA